MKNIFLKYNCIVKFVYEKDVFMDKTRKFNKKHLCKKIEISMSSMFNLAHQSIILLYPIYMFFHIRKKNNFHPLELTQSKSKASMFCNHPE